MKFSAVYPLYVNKVVRKSRTETELRQVICWLTGFTDAELQNQIDSEVTFPEFFENATLTPLTAQITGLICGIRVEDIEDPLLQKIRWLDKVVDELAKGKALEKIFRAN
jgi:hypothetical protein